MLWLLMRAQADADPFSAQCDDQDRMRCESHQKSYKANPLLYRYICAKALKNTMWPLMCNRFDVNGDFAKRDSNYK